MRVGGLVNKVMSTAFVCLLMASALGTLSGKVNAAMLDADYRPPTSILASPAGQGKIAFTRSVEGRYEINVINPDGSERMVLSQNGNRPEWSPDGTKIAFVSQREHSQDIYIMNADGTGEVRITYSSDWDWGPLAWSPSGTQIAFARTPPFFTENPDVWVMNADGSREIQLTTDPSDDWQPSWSPDGTKIAFVSYRGGYKDIWVMNADGSDPTNLINDSDWDFGDDEPAWSPDGSKIAFASSREGEIDRSIYVMNTDGSNITRLTTSTGDNSQPSWSPDGTRIAFASNRDGNYDIYIMNADGTNETRVTYDPANESGPSWGIAADTGVIEECLVTIIDDPEADPATVESNGSAQLSVSVTDSLDHDIYYSWTATGGSFDNNESQNPTWYAPVNTNSSTVYYTLSVTARCSQGTTANGSIQVGVRAEEVAPAVSTYDASNVDLTSATLNGYLESTSGLDCLVWFEYGTSISYERSTSRVSQSSEGPFSASISDLDPDTAYHFRACASNSEGTSYGSDVIFMQLTEEVRVEIDSCNVSPKELRLGEDSTLSFSFTNTGDTPWTFYAAVSLRQPNGAEVHLPLQPVALDPNQQGSAAWSYTINYEGGWDVVFGIWKEQEQENSLGHTSWLNDYIICVQDDTNAPRVEFLSTQLGSITLGDSFTISYIVSDLGGSALNRVELWWANDSNGSPADWVEITRNSASGNSDSGFFTDAPPSAGFYWYGIHAVDNAGNWATEDSSVKVEVKLASVTSVLQYTLTVSFNKLGSIALDPTGESPAGRPRFVISSSTGNLESSIFYYEAGTEVTLTAKPVLEDYVFAHWGGGHVTGNRNPETIVMDSDKSVTAYFQQITSGLEVANFDYWSELIALREALHGVLAQARGKLRADEEQELSLLTRADALISKIERGQSVRYPLREGGPTNTHRVINEIVGWLLRFPQFLNESVEALSEAVGESLELGELGLLNIKEAGQGVIYIAYKKDSREIWVNINLYDPVGQIYMFIPVEVESKEILVPEWEHDWLPGSPKAMMTTGSALEIRMTPTMDDIRLFYGCDALVIVAESPVEIRVYDSQGWVTGIVNGEVKEEIPNSGYYENTVTILSPSDSYSYEVIGTGDGSYGLTITLIAEETTNSFSVADAPISTRAVHQYTVDWDALYEGKKGVTMKIDSDGDGTFEDVRKLGSEGAGFSWVWIIVAGVSGLIGVFVGAFMVWRRIGKKQAA